MEENTARVNEIEEREPETEVDEVTESYSGGAFVAGIVGGFLAYAVIGGAKKLAALAQTKWAERKKSKTIAAPSEDPYDDYAQVEPSEEEPED